MGNIDIGTYRRKNVSNSYFYKDHNMTKKNVGNDKI